MSGIFQANLSVILVRTQFASNLGGCARVMKNMGYERLTLIQPRCEVGAEARAFSMQGDTLLDHAELLPSLESALRRCTLLVGTTRRVGIGRKGVLSPRDFSLQVLPALSSTPVGIVFGPEDNGLSREELRLCHWLVHIPTAPAFPSLNLAQAVGILCHELRSAAVPGPVRSEWLNEATPTEQQTVLERIEKALEALNPPEYVSTQRIMRRLRKLMGRARLESEDARLLHTLLDLLEFRRRP